MLLLQCGGRELLGSQGGSLYTNGGELQPRWLGPATVQSRGRSLESLECVGFH